MWIDVQPDVLAIRGHRRGAQSLPLDPLLEIGVEPLIRGRHALPDLGLSDLRSESGGGVLLRSEAALEPHPSGAVLERDRVLDHPPRPGSGPILPDPAFDLLTPLSQR